MIWITAIACFVVGSAVGALLFKAFKSDEARVQSLKQQLQQLSEEHEAYKSSVNSHFGDSARLLTQLTDSYREVYLHMAEGARSLCPDYISSQLALSDNDKTLLNHDSAENHPSGKGVDTAAPPLDYAAKADPQAAGPLSEEYGIDKTSV